jgi:hypothetical protein
MPAHQAAPAFHTLLGQPDHPLIARLEFSIAGDDYDFDAAHDELLTAMQGSADPLWGYFPQHPDQEFVNRSPLRHCQALDVYLREKVLRTNGIFRDLDLAFIRLCLRDIRGKEHGGFHTDIDSGSAFIGDAKNDGSRNICKLLINLHPTEPRELQYLSNGLNALAQMGVVYRRDSYLGVPAHKLPKEASICSAVVRPREKHVLHALAFWADLVPHTGVDHAHGHFLAGYGGYRPAGSHLIG